MLTLETTPEEVKSKLDRGEVFTLLDVREPWEWDTAHLATAKHIPMNDMPARLEELDRQNPIVVYCHHGVRSLTVTQWLRRHGIENAQSMAGGIDAWSREIDRQVPLY
jgi:rhodanese-related sulfurtransferase